MNLKYIENFLAEFKTDKRFATDKINNLLKEITNAIVYEDLSEAERKCIEKLIIVLTELGSIKYFETVIERDFLKSDFYNFEETAAVVLKFLAALFTQLCIDIPKRNQTFSNLIAPVIILCGSHSSLNLWTDEKCIKLSGDLIDLLVQKTKCETVLYLIMGSDSCWKIPHLTNPSWPGICNKSLKQLRNKLTKDTWKQNPILMEAFCWLLPKIRTPVLSEHIWTALPPCLMMTDDLRPIYQIKGMKCLQHLIDNVSLSELDADGKLEVLIHALYSLTYSKDSEIVTRVFPLLFLLFNHLEPVNKRINMEEASRMDKLYSELLWKMEMQQDLKLRKAYSASIIAGIQTLGIFVRKYLKRTLRVLADYIEVWDGPGNTGRINSLQALIHLISLLKLMATTEVMGSLLKCAYEVELSDDNSEIKEEILSLIKKSFMLFKQEDNNSFREQTECLKDLDEAFPSHHFILSLLEE